MKNWAIALLFIFMLFSFSILVSSVVKAAGTGSSVGVLNVGPATKNIIITPDLDKSSQLSTNLLLSDYNSYEDIFWVKITLYYYGRKMAVFTFKQFEDIDSFVKINTFTEDSTEGDLLLKEACTYSASSKKETVDEKCNLYLQFVFRTTWFTSIIVEASDRAGLKTTTSVDYNTEEMMRSSNMIVIPGLDEPILIGVSSFIINFLAIVAGAAGAIYLAKKMNLIGSVE